MWSSQQNEAIEQELKCSSLTKLTIEWSIGTWNEELGYCEDHNQKEKKKKAKTSSKERIV